MKTQKKSKFLLGFEPMNLCDVAGCSIRWASGDSVESNGGMWVFD